MKKIVLVDKSCERHHSCFLLTTVVLVISPSLVWTSALVYYLTVGCDVLKCFLKIKPRYFKNVPSYSLVVFTACQ